MALGEWQAREADSYSRRRTLMDKDMTRAFDAHYGKQTAAGSMSRNNSGAGKGDRQRGVNTLLYDLGYALSFEEMTDDERTELTAMWRRVKSGDAPPSVG